MPHYVIVANGDFLIKEIIAEAVQGKVIVALDGAANRLACLGIKPNIILGDFDSIEPSDAAYWGIQKTFSEINNDSKAYEGKQGVTIVPAKDQDLTDLIKGIHYCDKNNAESITLICAAGGRMDHHEGAVRSLCSEYKKNRMIFLHTEQQTLRFAKDELVEFHGKIGDKCGVLAYPSGSFTSTGLLYAGDNYPLTFAFSESICNSLKSATANIKVVGGALLVMSPQLASQRDFANQPEVARLELKLRDAKLYEQWRKRDAQQSVNRNLFS